MTYARDRITVKEKYGAYLVSDIIEGYYTDKFYIGYTREEAIMISYHRTTKHT